MENIADLYYEKLGSSDNPGSTLARFYESMFNLPYSPKDIVMFNRLILAYGKYVPYFSILDLFSFSKVEMKEDMFGLLSYYCKRRVEQKTGSVVLNDAYRNLDKEVKSTLDRIEEQKKLKINIDRME